MGSTWFGQAVLGPWWVGLDGVWQLGFQNGPFACGLGPVVFQRAQLPVSLGLCEMSLGKHCGAQK